MSETKMWKAEVRADSLVASVPGETKEEAEEYIKEATDTGDLGPPTVHYLQEDD